MNVSEFQKAFWLMIISALFGAMIAVAIKALSFHVSIAVIFFFTRVFILVGAIPTLLKHRLSILKSENKLKIAWISLFYIVAMYCYFYSLVMIPMSISSLFFNSSPLYVPLLAYFILSDPSIKSKKLWLAILISFVGVIFILTPSGHVHYSLLGIGLGFLSGLLIALWQVLTKQATGNESPHHIAFFQMITSIVVTFFPALFVVSSHGLSYLNGLWTVKNMSMLILAGISSWIYQLYRTRAMTHAPVSIIMPFGYFGVVFVGLFDWIFWDVMPSWISMFGMALVIVGVIFLLRVNNK